MKWIYDDGGRSNYYKAKGVRDCVCRALAIADNRDYKEVYKTIKNISGETPRNGVYEAVYSKILKSWGWECVECEHKNIYLKADDLPNGIVICKINRHLVTVKDKIIYDTWDCSKARRGKYKGEYDVVKVLKYWVKAA